MSFSLNEIDAMSKRAARGAGLDWGLAEEAAKATRWLCAHQLDGCQLLACILQDHHDRPHHLKAPPSLTGDWQAEALCPISTGASLSDCASEVARSGQVICNLHSPLFLLPFVAASADATDCTLSMVWRDTHIVTDGRRLQMQLPDPTLGPLETVDRVVIAQGGTLTTPVARISRALPCPQALETLTTLAALTYAPATESSRRLGAGSEQSDND